MHPSPNADSEIFSVCEDVYGVTLDDAETIAGYVIDDEEPSIVEPGTAAGVPRLLDALETLDIDPGTIRHVVVGHYHLDHAGGAPGILDAAPEATWYLHEAMADWLTESDQFDRLVTSSAESLGTQFEAMGAPEESLDPDRLRTVDDDGTSIDTGEYTLELVHTPGHTPDHVAVVIPERSVLLANEAIGRYFPKADVFHPPITIPAFDVEATRASIDRLADGDWDRVALSHFGVRDDPTQLFATAEERLDRFTDRIPALYDACDEDLDATIERVRSELIGLDEEYPADVAASQAEVCTEGLLRSVGRL